MEKQKAIEKAKSGAKITHESFAYGDFITYKDESTLIDESGNEFPEDEFWQFRLTDFWETGWRLVEEQELPHQLSDELYSMTERPMMQGEELLKKIEEIIDNILQQSLNYENYHIGVSLEHFDLLQKYIFSDTFPNGVIGEDFRLANGFQVKAYKDCPQPTYFVNK